MPRLKDPVIVLPPAARANGHSRNGARRPPAPNDEPAVILAARVRGFAAREAAPDPEQAEPVRPLLDSPELRAADARPAQRMRARNMPVEAAIIERYRRGDGTMEETMLEIHQAGISVRRAEAVARDLWGAQVNAATVSELSRRIDARIARWRQRPIRGCHPYVFLGAIGLRRRWGGETRDVQVLAAVGVNAQGFREVLAVDHVADRSRPAWRAFLRQLKARGLAGVRLLVGDADPELDAAAANVFPAARRQVCLWQLQRDLLARVTVTQLPRALALYEGIVDSATPEAARARARHAAVQLRKLRLHAAAQVLERAGEGLVGHLAFPGEHWKRLRSNFALMKVLRQLRERTRLVGAFSDGESAVLLVSARLRFIADQWRASPHRWDMSGVVAGTGAPAGDEPTVPRRTSSWPPPS